MLCYVQTDATLFANNSQHCWMLHVAYVCTPCCMLLRVVGRSCAKFETGQTLSYVQTDATSLGVVGKQCCVRLHGGLTQQNSLGGVGGGESSLLPIGVTSLCGRWICTTLPPEVRSWNTYDEIRRAFGLIKLPRWKLEKKSEIRREKKPLAPRVDMCMVYIDFSQRNSVISTLCFFLFMVLNRVLKQLSLFEEGKGREGGGWGRGDHEAVRTCC